MISFENLLITLKDLKKDINNLIKNFRDNNLIFPVKFKEFSYLLDKDNVSRTSCVTLPMEAFLKAFKTRL